MKKVILSLLVAFAAVSANAQIVSSTSRRVSYAKTESNTQWYGKVGLNVMNYYVGSGVSDDASAKIGYDINFGFQKPLGSSPCYWGMEFGLTSRGSKAEATVKQGKYYVTQTENEMRHAIVYSPFTIGFKKNLVSKLAIDAHAGVFLSADYTGKVKKELDSNLGKEYNGSAEAKMGDWNDFNRIDAGLKFGLGLWYDRFNFDLSYRQGFINAWCPENAETNIAGNFIVSVGVAF